MTPSIPSSDSSARTTTPTRVPSDVCWCVGTALGAVLLGWGLGHWAHHAGDATTQAGVMVLRGVSFLSYGFALLLGAAALEAWHDQRVLARQELPGTALPHGPSLHVGPVGVGLLLVVGLGVAASQLPWFQPIARATRLMAIVMPGVSEATQATPAQAQRLLAEPAYASFARHLRGLTVQTDDGHTVVQLATDAVHCQAARQWLEDHPLRAQALIVTEQGVEVPDALLACPRSTVLTFRARPPVATPRHLIRVISLGSLTLTV